jgi:hypothetical protein
MTFWRLTFEDGHLMTESPGPYVNFDYHIAICPSLSSPIIRLYLAGSFSYGGLRHESDYPVIFSVYGHSLKARHLMWYLIFRNRTGLGLNTSAPF